MSKFQDVEFMTAKEKELVLKQWITFLKYGCRWEHFTDRLYQHLIMHCAFIAHYNRHGFYDEYFTSVNGRRKFFAQFDLNQGGRSAEYGDILWRTRGDYEDINMAMCKSFMPPPDPAVERLVRVGIDEEDLDGLVSHIKSEEATVINNGGMERQVEYLVDKLGSIEELLRIFDVKEEANA